MGYPELAVGVLHKTRTLIDALKAGDAPLSEKVHLHQSTRLWVTCKMSKSEPYKTMEEVPSEQWKVSIEEENLVIEQLVYMCLAQALLDLEYFADVIKLCKIGKKLVGAGAEYMGIQDDQLAVAKKKWSTKQQNPDLDLEKLCKVTKAEAMKNGAVLLRQYPWMLKECHERSATLESRRSEIQEFQMSNAALYQAQPNQWMDLGLWR